MREKWNGNSTRDIREMKSLQQRGSCSDSGNKSQVGVQRWGLCLPPWEKDWVERMRSWNDVDISQGILGGEEQSSQRRFLSPFAWCWWGCIWNRVIWCCCPHHKNAGKLERDSLEDYQGGLGSRADVLGSMRRRWGNRSFLSSREKDMGQSDSSLWQREVSKVTEPNSS